MASGQLASSGRVKLGLAEPIEALPPLAELLANPDRTNCNLLMHTHHG